MAIYGIGAYYYGDVSDEFIDNTIVGTGWSINDAPEFHLYFRTLKVGDIVYLKAAAFGATEIIVKAIGVITDNNILSTANHYLTEVGSNVSWLNTNKFKIPRPTEKNNVRSNTVYEEFYPIAHHEIIRRI